MNVFLKFSVIISALIFFLNHPATGQLKMNAEPGVPETIKVFDGMNYDIFKIHQIKPSKISTTSTLYSKTNRYKKENVIDNDHKTAWVEGAKDAGVGEKLRFTFSESTPPDVISIVPGYMISEETWYKNNRVLKFKITILTAEDSFEPNEIIDEVIINVPVNNTGKISPGEYSVNISSIYLQNMAAEEFGTVEIEILEIDNKGSIYYDTCISEIRFYCTENT